MTNTSPWSGPHGPLLVAEIGGNHEGDFDYARRLADLAVDAGADAVKFQIYFADQLVNVRESPDRHAHFRRFELTPDQHIELARQVEAAGVQYLASVWSLESLGWIDPHLSFYKVGSGDLTSHLLLQGLAARGKPIALSTGLSTIEEIQVAVAAIRGIDARYRKPEHLAVLQCTSTYPLPKHDANLRAMVAIGEATGATMGYSDHTTDSQALEAATTLGARVLEFHFTDEKDGRTFRDHLVSLTPADLVDLRHRLDDLKDLLGDGIKRPLPTEIKADHVTSFRRAAYYARDLPAGAVVGQSDLVLLRPNHGLGAEHLDQIVGRRLARPVDALDRVDPTVFVR